MENLLLVVTTGACGEGGRGLPRPTDVHGTGVEQAGSDGPGSAARQTRRPPIGTVSSRSLLAGTTPPGPEHRAGTVSSSSGS